MSKELEALNDLINFIGNGEIADTHELCEYVAKRKDIIEKALKALEIIKDNKINGLELVWFNGMWFVFAPNCPRAIMYGTRKEEFDLLKEVLL